MLAQTLKTIICRDLEKLRHEIDSYSDEQALWRTDKAIANSAGNLCLHLVGNLNTYIGAELGNTGYVRHRDLEFSLKGLSKQDLVEKITATIGVVSTVLDTVTDEQLQKEYPIAVLGEPTTTEFFMVHLTAHLAYHLGQVNYHRRLLD